MLNLEHHQNKVKYLLMFLAVVLVVLVSGLIYKTNQEMKKETPNLNLVTEQTVNSPEQQLDEIQSIRKQSGETDTSQKTVDRQIIEIEKLRKDADTINTKTPEDQLKEIEALRK